MLLHISKNHNTASIRRLSEAFSNSIVLYHGKLSSKYINGTIPVKYRLIRHIWPLRLVYVFFSIKKKMDLKGVKIIHAHTLWGDGLIACCLNIIYKIPYIVSLRYSDIKIMKYKFWLKPLLKIIMSKAAARVAISANVNSRIYKQLGVEADSIIPNWIEEEFFYQKPLKKKREIDIIIIGRPVPRKKILESLVFFSKKNLNVMVVFGRIFESHYFKKCQEIVNKSDNINLRLNLSKTELIKLLDSSRIMWLPSTNETMGLVYVEALLRNCSVVGMTNQGLHGMVNNSKMIYQEKNENYNSLLKRVLNTLNDDKIDQDELKRFEKTNVLNLWRDLYEANSL